VKKFETKHYKSELGNYDVMMLTPIYKFYLPEKDRLEALGAVLMAGAGMMTPPDMKFKADFYEMSLVCDGNFITPIQRGKSELVVPMQSYYKVKNRFTCAGIYTYPVDPFEPGKCKQLTLNVFSEENPSLAAKKVLSPLIGPTGQAGLRRVSTAQDATRCAATDNREEVAETN
jgi:hypothetical protein